ncbi:putative spc97 spc98 family protein [Rosellinia necatrix]|uniref:Putative spc97 spc98 family protein n=1 Tax=Rosellinia necatrix TaxID=77044 RepID=A0A1W2TME2_ROSNE|nr:putative spc97 spc98 family protein [Rosellinia necatrix]
MSRAGPDRSKRVDTSINRLISQIIPDNPHNTEDENQQRHDLLFQQVKDQLERHHPPPLADQNHASELIRRRLVHSDPNLALRFSNLYSKLLALPILDQKWAMLYLLHQLTDSPDPNSPDPVALAEFRQEEARRQRRRDREEYGSLSPSDHDTEDGLPPDPTAGAYRPTDLRDVLKNPKELKSTDDDSPYGSAKHPASPAEWKRGKAQADEEPEPPKRDVAIKSQLLADNYSGIQPPEPSLLRDLPYTLQGVSSATLPFGPEYSLKLPSSLPPPLIGLLHTLAEPSLLCKSLQDFVKTPAKGLLDQSLRAAISDELRSYLTLVATLEGQIRRALGSIDETAPRNGIGKAGVTLKRCVVWTREATMGLRLLSLIAEESKTKKGGQIISLIHSFSTSHGDPIVGAFAERLLTPVTRPFYDILRHWIYDGELSDPYLEFFIQLKSTEASAKTKTGSTNVWDEKYEMSQTMIPSIVTLEFANKVHLIGKSLNFIRHSCSDAQWVESYSKASSKELRYGDTTTLESWIDDAYKITMRRLVHLMTHKFHLFEHLQALKSYILLGQGDFIALLMESLAANLDRPAGAQYRHTLTAQLEHAIRGSNAQYDSPEVLRRLDARMLQLSHGDIGWDCFTLEYKIDAPVDVVVSDWGNRQYLKVFNFLWRIKRVEFALSSTWRKVTTGSRGVLQTDHAIVQETWKMTRGFLAEMVHFVGQLQYYILFEVIESSWTELQARLKRDDATLDDIIKAHKNYLNSITHKGLLGARRRRFVTSSAGGSTTATNEEDDNSYMIQLGELLRTMLSYRDCVDGLYSWSVSDFTRRQEADLRRVDTSFDEDPGAAHSEFPALQERLRHLGDRFRTRLQILLGDLAYQPDVDLRFLGVSMNFNDVYQPVRRKLKSTPAPAQAVAGGADREKGKERERE